MGLSLRRRQQQPSDRMRVVNPASVGSRSNALTASGLRVRRGEADSLRRLIQPWQSRAFAYYDMLGEVKYAAQFYSRMLAPLRLYAAEMDENGELVETQNPVVVANLERVQDPGGGRTGLLSSYGRLMFLTGETYLTVTLDEENDRESWEMLSTDELRVTGANTFMRVMAPALMAEELREPDGDDDAPLGANEAIVYRIWKRHPRYSMLADSTMQGVLDLCEELVLLTQAVRSRARSRLAGSGILWISDLISPAPAAPVGDEDPMEDPFMEDLVNAMTAPIADEGAASAVVPLLVRVPSGRGSNELDLEKIIKHTQIIDPTQLYPETGLRREVIERIAIGLDMPPEVLLGMADANHWTGWMIDEQTWKGHGQPLAQQLCDDLTSTFFRPTLRMSGVADWQRYQIAYDATAIINHPDRTRDAKDLHKAGAIGDTALRDAGGFDEDDAPTPEERRVWLSVYSRDPEFALTGKSSRPPTDAAPADTEEEPSGGSPADVEKSPPERPSQTDEEPLPETVLGGVGVNGHGSQSQYAARILGASELAMLRAREAAGNRLINLAKKDRDSRAAIKDVRTGMVAAVLGRERARALGAPSELELVAGVKDLIAESLRMWKIDAKIADRLVPMIERHAAKTLWDEHPALLPAAFTKYVNGLTLGS